MTNAPMHYAIPGWSTDDLVSDVLERSQKPLTHVFTISTNQSSPFQVYDVARCGDVVAKSLKSCAARKLARLLIAIGTEDGPIEARGEDGKPRYTVKSLYAFARKTLVENPRLRSIPFVEFRGPVRPDE